MAESTFVGRDKEMARLNSFLDAALAGKGQVCFVAGEAGSGKTALTLEFVRRAQMAHPDLVAAMGNCNAQTGLGDAYLPFRELLALLFGDVEGKLAEGALNQENANRLRRMLAHSGQVLVELGPDLIGVLIPGGHLIGLAGKVAAQKLGWLDELEKISKRKREQPAQDRPALEQSQILEQYTRVLSGLAVQQPLILVLDDLQWADAASISLLFHMARRIGDSRILVIGTYRPDDITAGPAGEHPLAKTIAELKRYGGDIVIEVGQSDKDEGAHFVDTLLDSEPNELGPAFRRALLAHTEGHALFTVEVLHNLQERGDLVRNADGRWVEGPDLDWNALPARVEGVIEARIGRLEPGLREMLSVASVEGQDFTAQVISTVQEMRERDVLRSLATELDRRHNVVHERGVQRLGQQALFVYAFHHSLFHTYVYEQLGASERVLLHDAVGQALEHIYGEHAADIAPQLARHFLEAGDDDKAFRYSLAAGDAAAQACAYAEALSHYDRAVESGPRANPSSEQLSSLYIRRGRALEISGHYDKALANYQELEAAGRRRGDRSLELAALVASGTIQAIDSGVHDPTAAQRLADQAFALACDLEDRQAESRILWNLMLLQRTYGHGEQGIHYGEQALALARQENMREHTAFVLHDLAVLYFTSGNPQRGRAANEEAVQIWRETGNLVMLADALGGNAIPEFLAGNFDRSLQVAGEAYRMSDSIGQVWGLAASHFFTGRLWLLRGDIGRAMTTMEEAIRLAELSAHPGVYATNRHDLAWAYAVMGATEQALVLAQATLDETKDSSLPASVMPVALLARIQLLRGNAAAAEATRQQIDPAVALEGFYVSTAIEVAFLDAELALARHEAGRVIEMMDGLAPRLGEMRTFASNTFYLKAQALLALGRTDEAYDALAAARAIATAIGARLDLWPVLAAMSRLEAQRGNQVPSESLRAEARAVVSYIAEHAGTPELRASFLGLPDVRAVLG